jgi:hypothetical protein
MFGIKIRLGVEPRLTPRDDVGPCLLARVCCFFERHRVTVEKSPDRARCKACTMFGAEQLCHLNQRDVRLPLDRRQDHLAIGLDAM